MTDTPVANIPLLRKAVEWVEEQAALPLIDRQWFQGTYHASPAHMAAILMDGPEYDSQWPQNFQTVKNHCGTAYCVAGYIGMLTDERYTYQDQVGDRHVSDVAREALGLTHNQAHRLFAGANTPQQIRRIAEDFAGQPL